MSSWEQATAHKLDEDRLGNNKRSALKKHFATMMEKIYANIVGLVPRFSQNTSYKIQNSNLFDVVWLHEMFTIFHNNLK